MFVVGLILMLIALAVVVYIAVAAADLPPQTIDLGVTSANLTPVEIFLLGGATVVVLSIGTALFVLGLRKKARKNKELRTLRKERKSEEGAKPTASVDDDKRHDRTTPPASASDAKGASGAAGTHGSSGSSGTASADPRPSDGSTDGRDPRPGSTSGSDSPPPPPR